MSGDGAALIQPTLACLLYYHEENEDIEGKRIRRLLFFMCFMVKINHYQRVRVFDRMPPIKYSGPLM